MGKKMKLPFLFKTTETTSSWPWPYCANLKTLSFRAGDNMFKTMNSSYELDATTSTDSPELEAASTGGAKSVETVIRGLPPSERLFFDPAETSSISPDILCPQKSLPPPNIPESATHCGENVSKRESRDTIVWTDSLMKQRDTNFQGQRIAFEKSVVMEMESEDPLEDFKRSMEEMVEAHGLKKWECLEELLSWYLRANDKSNHGYVVRAFVELLSGLAFASSSSSSSSCSSSFGHEQSFSSSSAHTPTSPLSFSSSSSTTSTSSHCISSLEAEDEIEKT
ncbi:Transcription repressor like [Actinidia chinensis var. chinensis]|uniref:Transcription repressor n=1 Tax=Actinidia chinensis var. chinensis TaxID=1590841 RepID=A0A2R6RA20_ACTCC|nr:Transcription repressor like [Actinidia chinensis var. chinensis]